MHAQRGATPPGPDAPSPGLRGSAAEFYQDLRLAPLLRNVLKQSHRLLGGVGGSLSMLDTTAERYTKIAESGVACQLGRSFPVDEGVTGQVVSRRRPVVMSSYADLASGHLPPGHPARAGAAVAVPIWWRGDVVGANVVFAGRRRRFTPAEVDELDVLTQAAAAAIVTAGVDAPSLAHLLRSGSHDDGPAPTRVTEVGPVQPLPPEVRRLAVELVAAARRAATDGGTQAPLRVAAVYRAEGLRLLVHQEPPALGAPGANPAERPGPDLSEALGAVADGVSVEEVPGWGTLVRVDIPFRAPGSEGAGAAGPPLTPRERDVLVLLAQGLGDRQIAAALGISRKTVEKHVGGVLRKTGTSSRTAAAVEAVSRGWSTAVLAPPRP